MIFRLIFLNGASKGERITVPRGISNFGRDAGCSICIPDDDEIALQHCTLRHTENDELKIRDNGSMNKILVNNHEISEATLKHGDIIEIGRTRLLVQAFVQAEVRNSASSQRRAPGLLKPAVLLLAAAASIFLIRTLLRGKSAPPAPVVRNTEIIPPSVFKDLQATESVPEKTVPQEEMKPAYTNRADSPPSIPEHLPKADTAPETVKEPAQPEHGQKEARTPAPVQPSQEQVPAPPPLPSPVEITDLSQQKFPEKDEYDEMRVATVKLRTTGSVIENGKVAVVFEFFDRDLSTGEITAARAIVPTKAYTPQLLADNGRETMTAAYTVPKGLRSSPAADSGRTFYGVRVKVLYAGELVAQRAIPRTLMEDN